MKVKDKLEEAVKYCKEEYPDLEPMVAIVNSDSLTAVVVEEIYEDGFKGRIALGSFSIIYPFLPFRAVTEELADHIRQAKTQLN